MKLFIKTLFLIIIAVGGYLTYLYGTKPTSIYPYPYILKSTEIKSLASMETADVLIIGDRMASHLKKINNELVKNASPGFSQDLKILNWGEKNEGLHRTIKKIKALKAVPQLMIYHGASEEFYEKKFYLEENKNLDANLKKYNDPKVLSSIISFPPLSKYFYSYERYILLESKLVKNIVELPVIKKQIQLEMGYKIFQGELDELISLSKEKRFKLFLITTPINLSIPPKETCTNSLSNSLAAEHRTLEKMIKAGQTKQAFNELKKIGETIPGNAHNYFLLGLSLKMMGKFQEARAILEQGTAFDCFAWRSNIVFNNIIRNTAYLQKIPLIDFDQIVNEHFGHKQLFEDEIFPLKELYSLLVNKLAPKINIFFKD
ncbi:MAG: hypothetical protein DRQ88_11325 [Epsilonproteobacteria bacterium]|nr:MAG: hypothetical protein DRQ88_11325 [Campylobacterota bacterium]RLA65822.1 MAG: hypothetical protein DRQ89_00280 [Campylobacterota bacterium]